MAAEMVEKIINQFAPLLDANDFEGLLNTYDLKGFMPTVTREFQAEKLTLDEAKKLLKTVIFDLGGIEHMSAFATMPLKIMLSKEEYDVLDFTKMGKALGNGEKHIPLTASNTSINKLIIPVGNGYLDLRVSKFCTNFKVKQLIFKNMGKGNYDMISMTDTINPIASLAKDLEYIEVPIWILMEGEGRFNELGQELLRSHNSFQQRPEIVLTDVKNYREDADLFIRDCMFKVTTRE